MCHCLTSTFRLISFNINNDRNTLKAGKSCTIQDDAEFAVTTALPVRAYVPDPPGTHDRGDITRAWDTFVGFAASIHTHTPRG